MGKKHNNKDQLKGSTKLGRIGHRPMWVLGLSIGLRAIHQIGAAVFLTAFLIDSITVPPRLYVLLATASGLALLIAEAIRHRQILRELAGLTTFIKLIILGLAFHNVLPQTPTVVIAFIVASVGAHAPKIYRHRLLY